MKFTVHNIRSISKADMDIDGLTLVLGQNQSGKTTLLNTVAALMLGERNLYGATAKDASPVLRKGEEVASAQLAHGGSNPWSNRLIWPAYDHGTVGTTPPSNEITLGRVDPAGDFKPKEWAAFVRQISGAGGIKRQDIEKSLGEITQDRGGCGEEFQGLMSLLKQGWDVAAKHAEDKRTEARRRWEKITNERFGASKADGWAAEGYTHDEDIERLEKHIAELEAAARKADVKAELLDTDIPTLKADILERGGQSNALGHDLEALRRREAELQKALSFYPHTDPLACPHCGAMVEIKSGKIAKHEQGEHVRGSDEHKQLVTKLGEVQTDIEAKSDERGKLVAMNTADQALLKRLEKVV